MCGQDAATTPEVFTNGLYIKIYPNLILLKSCLDLLEVEIPSQYWQHATIVVIAFLVMAVLLVALSWVLWW